MIFDIEQKARGNIDRNIKIESPQDVFEMKEIQEIKEAQFILPTMEKQKSFPIG